MGPPCAPSRSPSPSPSSGATWTPSATSTTPATSPWFESARIALFERVGLATAGTPSEGLILARTHCEFLAPLHWPGEVVVGTGITRLGTKSFTMLYELARADAPDHLAARGEGVVVMLDYRCGETVPISEGLRGRLEEMTIEGAP